MILIVMLIIPCLNLLFMLAYLTLCFERKPQTITIR